MLTPWEAKPEVVWGIAITLIAAIWMRFLVAKHDIRVWHLLVNGVMYLTYLAIVLG
jgi:cation:H+ antiporter